MLELSYRDVSIKGKKLRRKGLVTGTLRRKNNEIIHISLLSKEVEKYIDATNYKKDLDVVLNEEIIHAHIREAQRDFTMNTVINMDFVEV